MTEQAIDRFRGSTMGWLLGTLAGWGTLLLIVGGAVLTPILSDRGVGPWPLALTVLGLAIVAVKWVQNMSATFEVTPDRLVIRRGIIMKSIDEIELYRIKDVRIDFSIINQLADIGTICVSSSDETTRTGDLVMRHVGKARERREHLRRLVDAARQRRGVRELDMTREAIS
jgi:uncharacterized membrane protein YdbT with pleckstrin-like domain